MGVEIERKFLLTSGDWRAAVSRSSELRQGYLSRGKDSAIRVRITGDRAELNIKSTRDGIHRLEFEYPVPKADAETMLDRIALPSVIEKTRHIVEHAGHTWEIDEFFGDNAGLVVAEIELSDADEDFERPDWLGEEVSTDERYYNSNLSEHPYGRW